MSEQRWKVHFVGVGGAGLSALARLMLLEGHQVTGSDLVENERTRELQGLGMPFQAGHRPTLIKGAELVVYSSAVPPTNPELQWARSRGVRIWKRHQLLPWITRGKKVIAVAGSHGKTTTTAMISHVLISAGLDPTCIVGGVVPEWGTGLRRGKGNYMVLEADEYERTFLCLWPYVGVVTALEHDHPDCYKSSSELEAAFRQFAAQCSLLVMNTDTALGQLIASSFPHAVTYGCRRDAQWRLVEVRRAPGGLQLSVAGPNGVDELALPLWGTHNGINAVAALIVAELMGVPHAQAAAAIASMQSVERRFSIRGPAGGVYIVDDYAHHPTQVRAALEAARQSFPSSRIVVLFQPHTYSRLETFFAEFAASLGQADGAFVLPVYGAREQGDDRLASKLAEAAGATFLGDKGRACEVLVSYLRPGDVLLNLNAGDAVQLTPQLLEELECRPQGSPVSTS